MAVLKGQTLASYVDSVTCTTKQAKPVTRMDSLLFLKTSTYPTPTSGGLHIPLTSPELGVQASVQENLLGFIPALLWPSHTSAPSRRLKCHQTVHILAVVVNFRPSWLGHRMLRHLGKLPRSTASDPGTPSHCMKWGNELMSTNRSRRLIPVGGRDVHHGLQHSVILPPHTSPASTSLIWQLCTCLPISQAWRRLSRSARLCVSSPRSWLDVLHIFLALFQTRISCLCFKDVSSPSEKLPECSICNVVGTTFCPQCFSFYHLACSYTCIACICTYIFTDI